MDRQFDYAQKIFLAVELADAPRRIDGMPASYARFKRLAIPDVVRAFEQTQGLFARLIAGHAFRDVLEQHMGYWEQRIPEGQQSLAGSEPISRPRGAPRRGSGSAASR